MQGFRELSNNAYNHSSIQRDLQARQTPHQVTTVSSAVAALERRGTGARDQADPVIAFQAAEVQQEIEGEPAGQLGIGP